MTTIDAVDNYIDDLYHSRDLAYDNEDYDAVREINLELERAMNVDEIDDLDDYDEEYSVIDEDDEYLYDEELD